jgi:hypothetical protein
MKNFITSIVLLFVVNSSFSQTLEHQYIGDFGQIYQVGTNEFVYGIQDDTLKQFRIYALDHTLIKTINLFPDSSYSIIIYNVSKTLFNSDLKFEITYTWWTINNYYGVKIINEDGITLLSQDWVWGVYFFNSNQGAKMILSNIKGEHEVDVYSLYGTVLHITENNDYTGSYIFPNPAANNIHINFTAPGDQNNLFLSVYSIDNRLIKEQKLSPNVNETQLDVSDLKSGIYIYKIHNSSYSTEANKFIVRK